jgi:diamine N-acetyltransferase
VFDHHSLRIRPIEENDLDKMVKLRADPAVWMTLGTIHMVSLRQQKEWYQRMLLDPSQGYYILCTEQIDFVGIVRMDEIDYINRSIRVGGDILPRYQRQGYGTRMMELLKSYCFDYLNMNRIWLLVLESNKPGIKLYRKTGFIEEGRQRQAIYRDGRYLDYIMMSILKQEFTAKTSLTGPSELLKA